MSKKMTILRTVRTASIGRLIDGSGSTIVMQGLVSILPHHEVLATPFVPRSSLPHRHAPFRSWLWRPAFLTVTTDCAGSSSASLSEGSSNAVVAMLIQPMDGHHHNHGDSTPIPSYRQAFYFSASLGWLCAQVAVARLLVTWNRERRCSGLTGSMEMALDLGWRS
jgi:hypothetical protein